MPKRRVKVGDVVVMEGVCHEGCNLCPRHLIGHIGEVVSIAFGGYNVRFSDGAPIPIITSNLHVLGDVRG